MAILFLRLYAFPYPFISLRSMPETRQSISPSLPDAGPDAVIAAVRIIGTAAGPTNNIRDIAAIPPHSPASFMPQLRQ